MKTIEQLEEQLKIAQQKNLIVSYEHILNKDYLLVQLHEDCPDDIKNRLATHIKETYRSISFVVTTGHPSRCFLHVKYNEDFC